MAILPEDSSAIIEACVDSTEKAIRAQDNGADRIELCADLSCGGLTPSESLLTDTLSALRIPVKVMLRPRAGDFTYNAEDKSLIQTQIELLKSYKCRRIVYGSLLNGRLDIADLKAIYEASEAEEMTIHKAIDASIEPMKDIHELVKWAKSDGVRLSILSSGQAETAIDGAFRLRRMRQLCGNEIELIAAGRITTDNLKEVQAAIPTRAYHGRKIV